MAVSLNVGGATKAEEEKYFNLIEMMNANTLAKFLRMNKCLRFARKKIFEFHGKEFEVKRNALFKLSTFNHIRKDDRS